MPFINLSKTACLLVIWQAVFCLPEALRGILPPEAKDEEKRSVKSARQDTCLVRQQP